MLGLDWPAVERWLAQHTSYQPGAQEIRQLTGGRSNLTYAVTDASGRSWVVRRPPVGRIAKGAHDVLREARIMSALATAGVPVPRVEAMCEDDSVTGAPFIVVDFVEGDVLFTADQVEQRLAPDARRGLASTLVDSLVRVHDVDPAATGLPYRTGGTPFVERQINRWLTQSESEGCAELPLLLRTGRQLLDRMPRQGRTTIVHGDFRLENCILDPLGSVVAILDWELATVGDPMTDIGLLLAYWGEGDDPITALAAPPTIAQDVPTRSAVRDLYCGLAGVAEGVLDFYETLGWWKLACVVGGVHARIMRGAIAPTDRDAESFGAQATRLAIEASRRILASTP